MGIDERLVELLLEAEERLERGETVAVENLCPQSPELWPALREALDGLKQLVRLMTPTDANTASSKLSDGVPAADLIDATPVHGIASHIGRYRLIRLLGQGGFGKVYLAHDDQLDRPVAIKVPHPQRIVGERDAEAFLAEARTLARLDHPHIVPVYDAGQTDRGLCYVVSKYVRGSTSRSGSSSAGRRSGSRRRS
jgi:hypothetical protein